ncbi:MAG: hypothetical protein LBU23_05140 [Planctomycetota bacterium]|jgi:hypothetical protein|nr:hypothetical protein [Planctomycetota bacterium]
MASAVDYSKLFKDYEALADHIMLDAEEQDGELARLTEEGKAEGMEMSCDLVKKAEMAREKAQGRGMER